MTEAWNQRLGRKGEAIAVRFLEDAGYTVLEQRYRDGPVEIDIIAHSPSNSEFVFVEVKARQSHRLGRPEEAVGRKKQQNLAKAAEAWLENTNHTATSCRFDIIAITFNPELDIKHFRDAFWIEDS